MTRILQGVQTVLNEADANGAGVALDVRHYKAVELQVRTKSSAVATIKFAISQSSECPDFSSAPSYTNPYDYVDIVWLNNNSSVPGSTGIVLTGTDIVKCFEVNTNFIKWLCPIVSGYSAGEITVEVDAANDYSRG